MLFQSCCRPETLVLGVEIDFLARKILASVASYVGGSRDNVINHYQLVQLCSSLEYSVSLEAF